LNKLSVVYESLGVITLNDRCWLRWVKELKETMRKQGKIVVWPVYFDSTRTREEGRRVPKNMAVASPRLDEISSVLAKLGFQVEVVSDVAYPKMPWRKTGVLLVVKKGSKQQLLRKIGKELVALRMRSQSKG
jgi:signal recognition particle subunit SRP19